MSTPRAYRTPTLTASLQGKKRKQCARESSSPRQSHKITIKRKKPSTNLIPPPTELNDDVDDSGTRLEPESHKGNPKNVDDDDDIKIEKENKEDEEIEKEKKDDVDIEKENKDKEIEKEKNDDNVEETDEVVKEKDVVDDVTGSMEIRKDHKQTPIPSPTRSPKNVSSSDKIVFEELTATVSPTTATTSKIREVLDHCNKVVPDVTFAKTKEMITQEMPRLVNLAVNKDREVDPINAKEMIAKEFATHGPKMIEELF
ncbi:hypothetical protein Tco_0698709 [Tanacetum coccineum]